MADSKKVPYVDRVKNTKSVTTFLKNEVKVTDIDLCLSLLGGASKNTEALFMKVILQILHTQEAILEELKKGNLKEEARVKPKTVGRPKLVESGE